MDIMNHSESQKSKHIQPESLQAKNIYDVCLFHAKT